MLRMHGTTFRSFIDVAADSEPSKGTTKGVSRMDYPIRAITHSTGR